MIGSGRPATLAAALLLAMLLLPGPVNGGVGDGGVREGSARVAVATVGAFDAAAGAGLGPGSVTPATPAATSAEEREPAHRETAAADDPDDWRDRIASPFLRASGKFILAVLAFSQIFAVIRLMRGPTLADRVIALDFIGITCAAMIGVYSVVVEEPLYLRAAIVLSLVSFLGTVGFALYCEKRGVP